MLIYTKMLVIVAPPIVMGAWSMAFLLRQHVEILNLIQKYYLEKGTYTYNGSSQNTRLCACTCMYTCTCMYKKIHEA